MWTTSLNHSGITRLDQPHITPHTKIKQHIHTKAYEYKYTLPLILNTIRVFKIDNLLSTLTTLAITIPIGNLLIM